MPPTTHAAPTCPSQKILVGSTGRRPLQYCRFILGSIVDLKKDPVSVLTAYLVDVDIVGDCVVTDGVVAEPLHGDQGGVVPLTK